MCWYLSAASLALFPMVVVGSQVSPSEILSSLYAARSDLVEQVTTRVFKSSLAPHHPPPSVPCPLPLSLTTAVHCVWLSGYDALQKRALANDLQVRLTFPPDGVSVVEGHGGSRS